MDGGNERSVAITSCFKAGLSATVTLVLVQKAYGNEALNRSRVFRWYSRFRDGRRAGRKWRESWPCKIDSNWGKHCCCCGFGQKMAVESHQEWLAESLNIPILKILILKEDLGMRKLCALFSPHSLTSHLAKTGSRWPMQTNIFFFKQNYYRRWDLVFCLWPRNKATDFWISWWDIPSAAETEIPKAPHQDHFDNFFSTLKSQCTKN